MNDSLRLAFNRRPVPVLVDHRPLYKMAEVVLVLYLSSRSARSSLPRLHLFNWALKTPERVDVLSQAARQRKLTISTWGFDPALAVALRYLCGEELLIDDGAKFTLSAAGESFANILVADGTLMTAVKRDLAHIGKGITESMVEAIAKEWRAQ